MKAIRSDCGIWVRGLRLNFLYQRPVAKSTNTQRSKVIGPPAGKLPKCNHRDGRLVQPDQALTPPS